MRIWRQNTGMAYGFSQVKSNIALLLYGRFPEATAKFRAMQPTRYGQPGMPDIQGILAGGRALGIEAKMPGKVQTDEQKDWQAMFADRYGGLYILAYSLDDVYDELRAAGVPT